MSSVELTVREAITEMAIRYKFALRVGGIGEEEVEDGCAVVPEHYKYDQYTCCYVPSWVCLSEN
jgi:hypothetical protein